MPRDWRALTADDCEAIAFARIPVEYRRDEPQTMASRWFDYRRLHPVQATYLFAEHYVQAVRIIYAQTRDRKAAETVKVLAGDPLDSRAALSFWLARQAYDRIGCRYLFGLRWTMTRKADRGWQYFPQANQLYGTELLLDLADHWKGECAASMQFATEPFFKSDAFIGHPDQLAYERWQLEQIRKRATPADAWRPLSRALGERALIVERIAGAFSPSAINKALSIVGASISQS
jgi:hypothetical protein